LEKLGFHPKLTVNRKAAPTRSTRKPAASARDEQSFPVKLVSVQTVVSDNILTFIVQQTFGNSNDLVAVLKDLASALSSADALRNSKILKVVFDFNSTELTISEGSFWLGLLESIYDLVKERRGRLVLANVTESAAEILCLDARIASLNRYASEADARHAIRRASQRNLTWNGWLRPNDSETSVQWISRINYIPLSRW
jgi:hypothetical protein